MKFFAELENILKIGEPLQKIEAFQRFYQLYRKGQLRRETDGFPEAFSEPSYRSCCQIIDPKEVPRRNHLGSRKGQVLLLHAIAHIEYSAIDLALDAAYRFRDMEDSFYSDWLTVAEDEVRHFKMIDGLLRELGSFYGEYPVHNALFEASQRTPDLLERMAVVPRYLEANGLDATPQILKKLEHYGSDPMIVKIKQALNVILDEEIDHVRKGDRWFHYACEKAQVDPMVYFEIIERHYPQSFPRRVTVNTEARKEAGFVCEELGKISATKPC